MEEYTDYARQIIDIEEEVAEPEKPERWPQRERLREC
jgi:hypothetical protein